MAIAEGTADAYAQTAPNLLMFIDKHLRTTASRPRSTK
jgi:hypothetical protein